MFHRWANARILARFSSTEAHLSPRSSYSEQLKPRMDRSPATAPMPASIQVKTVKNVASHSPSVVRTSSRPRKPESFTGTFFRREPSSVIARESTTVLSSAIVVSTRPAALTLLAMLFLAVSLFVGGWDALIRIVYIVLPILAAAI